MNLFSFFLSWRALDNTRPGSLGCSPVTRNGAGAADDSATPPTRWNKAAALDHRYLGAQHHQTRSCDSLHRRSSYASWTGEHQPLRMCRLGWVQVVRQSSYCLESQFSVNGTTENLSSVQEGSERFNNMYNIIHMGEAKNSVTFWPL